MNSYSSANDRARIKRGMSKKPAVFADATAGAHRNMAVEHTSRADDCAFPDDAQRSDVRGVIDLGGRRNDSRRMHSGAKLRFGKKKRQHLGEGDAGIGHPDQSLCRGGKVRRNKDGAGGALLGACEVSLILGEGQIARLSGIRLGEAPQHHARISEHFATEMFRNVRRSKSHGQIG